MPDAKTDDVGVLKYALPGKSAEHYTKHALRILKEIQKFDVSVLPYFLAADIVLTLSGVRAYDTYITLEGLHKNGIKQLTKFFKARGYTFQLEDTEYDEPSDFYFLLNHSALNEIPKQYAIPGWFNPKPPHTIEREIVWTYFIEYHLRSLMAKNELPKAWLKDFAAPHNIRFGILLGYPGEAIADACWTEIASDKNKPESTMANIAYYDAYNAAWPTYFYSKRLEKNQHIRDHQKLWSDILRGVYESHWHKSLQNNTKFTQAAEIIRQLKA